MFYCNLLFHIALWHEGTNNILLKKEGTIVNVAHWLNVGIIIIDSHTAMEIDILQVSQQKYPKST